MPVTAQSASARLAASRRSCYGRPVVEPLQSRVLQRAARVVGGYGELQERLDASREDMISWIRGGAMPPVAVFVKLVDILLDAAELGRAPPM